MFLLRSDRCCHCEHHHAWRSFVRGMVAMFVLAFAVLGLLDYPHAHHPHRAAAHHSDSRTAASGHREHRHHDRPRHAEEHRARPRPKPASAHHQARHRPARHRRSPAGGTSLTAAGQGLTWTGFHGIALPVSATAGPRHRNRGLASGFADNPRGALLAAINIAIRSAATWGPAIFRPTIARQVTGPNARALLRADLRAYARTKASGTAPGQQTAVEEAYRFLTCTPARASIDLVTSGPGANGTPVLVVTRLHVVWLHGDWRLLAPPAGNWAKAAAPITTLAGYTIFPNAR
jgi:hypothetical protein